MIGLTGLTTKGLKLIKSRSTEADLAAFRHLIGQKQVTDQMVLGLTRNGLLDDQRPYAARGRDTRESLLIFSWVAAWGTVSCVYFNRPETMNRRFIFSLSSRAWRTRVSTS